MGIKRPWPAPIPVTGCWVTLGKSQTLGFRLTSLCSAGSEYLSITDTCTRSYYSLRVIWKLHFCSPLPWYSSTPSLDLTSQNTEVMCLNTYNVSVSLTPMGHRCATDNQNLNDHRQKCVWSAMYMLDVRGKRARNFERHKWSLSAQLSFTVTVFYFKENWWKFPWHTRPWSSLPALAVLRSLPADVFFWYRCAYLDVEGSSKEWIDTATPQEKAEAAIFILL